MIKALKVTWDVMHPSDDDAKTIAATIWCQLDSIIATQVLYVAL